MKEKIRELVEDKLPVREELDERQERLLDTNIFFGKMLLVGAVFHLILYLYPNTVPIQAAFGDLITGIMNSLGYSFSSPGVFILQGEKAYEITQDCLGWKSMMAFVALMYASPGRLRDNLKYLGAGLLLIAAANVVRVVTTIHLSELGIISFEIIHGVLWKWGLTALVLVGWAAWFRYGQ
jgi:exosortase/archaeosortase family protein